MKYLGILTVAVLMASCATVPSYETTGFEREAICKIDNANGYWGDCLIKSIKADPNDQKATAYMKKNYPKAYAGRKVLEYLNDSISKQLANNEMTPEVANAIFSERLNLYRVNAEKEAEAVDTKKGCMALAFSSALNPALAAQNASIASGRCGGGLNAMAIDTDSSAPKSKFTYYLKTSYPSGLNRICIYNNGVSDLTETIDGIEFCENSIRR